MFWLKTQQVLLMVTHCFEGSLNQTHPKPTVDQKSAEQDPDQLILNLQGFFLFSTFTSH